MTPDLWVRRAAVVVVVLLLAVLAAATLFRSDTTDVAEELGTKPETTAVTDPAPQIRPPRITATPTRIREPDASPEGRLVDAARHGRSREVRKLLDDGVVANVTDLNGDMPLHQSARAAAPETMQLLLTAGADPNVSDGLGWFPLSYAVLAGSLGCTEQLLAAGAEVQSQIPGGSPLDPLISGWLAAEAGIPDAPGKRESERVEVARAILEAGGTSAVGDVLRKAITVMKNEDLVAVLLEFGARLDTSTSTGSALMRLRGPIGERLREAAEDTRSNEESQR